MDENPTLTSFCLRIIVFAVLARRDIPFLDCSFFSGVTIMLAITIFSTIIGDMLPVSENTPLIGQHLNFSFRKFKSNFVVDEFHQKLGQNPSHVASNSEHVFLITFPISRPATLDFDKYQIY